MTAYDIRISDWSSDVCSSDLFAVDAGFEREARRLGLVGGDMVQGREFVDAAIVADDQPVEEIGRASCRVRVCQYVLISGGAVSFKKRAQDNNRLNLMQRQTI